MQVMAPSELTQLYVVALIYCLKGKLPYAMLILNLLMKS